MKGSGEEEFQAEEIMGWKNVKEHLFLGNWRYFIIQGDLAAAPGEGAEKVGKRPICWRTLLTHSSDDWIRKAKARSCLLVESWPTVKARREEHSNPSCRSKEQDWNEFLGHRAGIRLAKKENEEKMNRMAPNKSGAATVATRAFEGLLSLFKGPREGWTR